MTFKSSRILPESAGNLFAVEIGDRMTLAEYRDIFENAAEKIFSAYPEGRLVLKYTQPFLGWQFEAAEADFKILTEKGHFLSRIALVDPPESVMPKWQTLKPVLKGEIKIFSADKYEEAVAWAKS